jgi:tight adherence protein C
MTSTNLVLGVGAFAIGVSMIVATFARSRRFAVDLAEVIEKTDGIAVVNEFQQRLTEPFSRRVVRTVTRSVAGRFETLMPRNHLANLQRKLQLAGLSGKSASEALIGQVALSGLLGLLGFVLVVLSHPSRRFAILMVVGLPVVGLMLPTARLNRKVNERKQAILNDLPDTLDLLAISVEAGMGFEGALSVVCQYFKSPLADEFSLTLREMELGLPRHEAFHNLKNRTQVPDLSSFILALVQADALGIPIGRVLKTQSTEMRSKRRMWAREKAGKLPVKIMFPLVLFIFPPVMVIVLGPAVGSLSSI